MEYNNHILTSALSVISVVMIILSAILLSKRSALAAEITVSPETQRFINGQSELKRIKYFNICGGGTVSINHARWVRGIICWMI